MKTTDIIRKALGFLKKGWMQYQLTDDDGRYCAIGALSMAISGDPRDWSRGDLIECACRRIVKANQLFQHENDGAWDAVVSWNNNANRTQAQVIRGFEKALQLGMARRGKALDK